MTQYPVLPLRDIVVFPHMIVPLFVGRDKSVAALEAAMAADKEIFLVAQLDPAEDDPSRDDLYTMGVTATVLQLLKLPDGTVRVLVEGKVRATLETLDESGDFLKAEVATVADVEVEGAEVTALMRRWSISSRITPSSTASCRPRRRLSCPRSRTLQSCPTRWSRTSRSRSPTSRRC